MVLLVFFFTAFLFNLAVFLLAGRLNMQRPGFKHVLVRTPLTFLLLLVSALTSIILYLGVFLFWVFLPCLVLDDRKIFLVLREFKKGFGVGWRFTLLCL